MQAFPPGGGGGALSTISGYTLLYYGREVTLGLTGHQRLLGIIRYGN